MTTEIISTITEAPHSRPGLLGLMAKALALSTIPATQALASADATALAELAAIKENPELLALDDALYDVRCRLEAATARYEETIAIGEKAWPRAPEIIIADHWHRTPERDIRGAPFLHATHWDDHAPIKRY